MISKAITITFISTTDDSDLVLVLELDDEKNESATQFDYNTIAYFRAYTYPSDMKLDMSPTDGIISSQESGTSDDEEEFISFVDTNEAVLSKPCLTVVSTDWLGRSLGAISVDGTKVTSSKEGTGVLKIKYKSRFRRYGLYLTTRDEDTYPVIIYVVGTR